ncbi:hypothetical protein ACOTBZ_28650 [Achromobacter xylosoxidans]|uniref:hypothetical protein n=1 Tax=Achromobacter ruhlandii TaxID=72557 RepID=UPI0015822DFF|nr:hypothetical protein [Achromobacter ruhlandii]
MAAALQMAPELDGVDLVVVYGETDDSVVDALARRHFLHILAMADDGLVLTSLAIDRNDLGPALHERRVSAATSAALLAAAGRWLHRPGSLENCISIGARRAGRPAS